MTGEYRRVWSSYALLIAVIVLLVGVSHGQASQDPKRDTTGPSPSGTVMVVNNWRGDNTTTLEYIITGTPATASVVLQGCMKGGTCDTIDTNILTANSIRTYSGPRLYDNFQITPTFTGGSSPALQVNRTSVNNSGATSSLGLTQSSPPLTSGLTLTNATNNDAPITEKGSRWVRVSAPASGSQATNNIAALAGGRHILDCLSFSASSTAAVTATNVTVTVTDGTTTLTWAEDIPTVAGVGTQVIPAFAVCGFNIPFATNATLTVAFSAGVTGVAESVIMTGYSVAN